MFGSVNIPECVTCRGNICSSTERTVFLSEFGSLNTFLPVKRLLTLFLLFLCAILFIEKRLWGMGVLSRLIECLSINQYIEMIAFQLLGA